MQIGQIAITVSDIDRAVAFYRDKLNLPFLFQFPGLAFFNCGARLMLTLPEKDATGNSVIYFKVADIQQRYQELTAAAVPFEGPPHLIAKMPDHELWMAFFRDPDRNLLGLMSEVPRV